MDSCARGALILDRLLNGARQTVLVQHITVGDGGQAVVAGNVEPRDRVCCHAAFFQGETARMSEAPHETNGNALSQRPQPRPVAAHTPGAPALPCQKPAMPNGRCRLHGGASTGAQDARGHCALYRRADEARPAECSSAGTSDAARAGAIGQRGATSAAG